ncbi:MAG: hypothetical protein WCL39_15095, partial [Armatimonadota bacterium]
MKTSNTLGGGIPVTRLIALFLAGVMLVGHGAGAAPAVAAKPAAPAEATVEALTAADARLSTLVTLEAQQKRLHWIASQLTAMTGVTIRTGRNDKDWEVRDIPQTIWVKDIPLGRLLKAIADVSHLRLSVEGVKGEDGKTVRIYRIWRDSKMRRAIDDYVTAQRRWSLERDSWSWDKLVKIAESGIKPTPDDPKEKPDANRWGSTPEMARMFSRMLSALGPEAKAQVMAGQQVQVRASDLPNSTVLREFYKTAWTRHRANTIGSFGPTETLAQPSENDLANASIVISLDDYSERPSLQASM